jgi:glycosyltransferase involved in cell wall biosynthesis
MPRVSVIIPSYNGERFIEETVRSVLDQTFRDLELVVVDDGSTDTTRALLRKLATGDRRLRVVEKPNEGLVATLNRAIAESRGDLIARLDHDDLCEPDRIAKQAAFLDSNPAYVAVGCLIRNIDEKGVPLGKVRIRHDKAEHDPAAFPPRLAWLYGPTPMVRADALRQAGGYREKFLAAEDRDLCWRLGALGKIERLPEPLVKHRLHSANMSRTRLRTQIYSAVLSDLSALARHYRLDDGPIIDRIELGGDYASPIASYRALLGPHYSVDSYLYYCQMRFEIWDMPGFPTRERIQGELVRFAAMKPWDMTRLKLLRRALTYLSRKPRGLGGHLDPSA